jgi:glycosyltransferase involved in cell wall biosynthesis
MKVLMLNTFDDVGGADRAACRLQGGLRDQGIDSTLLVQFKFNAGSDVLCAGGGVAKLLRRLKLYLGMLPVRLYPNRPENNFTPALFPDRLAARVAEIAPDLLHLHWLGAGFCQIETIGKFSAPLVWTLHDSWPFTGGCHVPGACSKYRERCGACPVLGSSREKDLSRRVWLRKERAWRGKRITAVAPSRWLADCAGASSLFRDCRVEVIPNGLDTRTFRPMEKRAARELLGLPQERPIILFGAVNATSDRNKGWHLLQPALKIVAGSLPDALAVVFGAAGPAGVSELAGGQELERGELEGGQAAAEPLPVEPVPVGMAVSFLGRLKEDASLVAAYSAADVLVVPSLQEAFCQTATEAMACGTPVVAFGATGLLDVVDHQQNGYLAQPYDVEDLARGIAWVIGDPARQARLSSKARSKVEAEFSMEKVARRYITLYRELLAD